MSATVLDLARLSREYMPTEAAGLYMAEAAAVCFDSQNHATGVRVPVTGIYDAAYIILFDSVTDQMRRAHGDLEVATENGAYSISILIIGSITGLSVVERSRKGTRFDYWLGGEVLPDEPFQKTARLEVSGIRQGSDGTVDSRLKRKLQQVSRSDDTLPAYVVVVEFSAPKAKVAKK